MKNNSGSPDDPLRITRVNFFCVAVAHPLLAGLLLLGVFVSDVRAYFKHWVGPFGWSIPVVPLATGVLLLLACRTRRASIVLFESACSSAVLALDVALLGVFMVAQGSRASGNAITYLWLSTLAGHVLLAALIEWRTGAQLWRDATESGRIDLEKGILDPRVPIPQKRAGRAMAWQLPVALGPCIGVITSRILRFAVGPDVSLLVGGIIALPGSMLITYAWSREATVLLRTIRWELQTRRTMRIPRE